MNVLVLCVTALGMLVTLGASVNLPVDPLVSSALALFAMFVILPLLGSAVLNDRLSAHSLALGAMLSVVFSMLIGLFVSGFPVQDRPQASRQALAAMITGIGLIGARSRRRSWIIPSLHLEPSRIGRSEMIVLTASGLVLAAAIVVSFLTPNRVDPYVSLSATTLTGKGLPAIIQGRTGSTTSILVEILNASSGRVSGQLIVTAEGSLSSSPVILQPRNRQSVPVELTFRNGESSVRVDLQSNSLGLDRFIVLRLRGT